MIKLVNISIWFGRAIDVFDGQLQDLPLFNDTIYYNILYGRLGASQEDIFQAAQQAAVHDQILAMPDGYASFPACCAFIKSKWQAQQDALYVLCLHTVSA